MRLHTKMGGMMFATKFQESKLQSEEIRLGHLKLEFGAYLEIGICHLEFQSLFGSG
jgi:hypothetical protein